MRRFKAGTAEETTGLWNYTEAIKGSEVWKDLWRVRNFRPAFQKGFIYGGMVAGAWPRHRRSCSGACRRASQCDRAACTRHCWRGRRR